jgi:hypothetical protein
LGEGVGEEEVIRSAGDLKVAPTKEIAGRVELPPGDFIFTS